MPGPDGSGQGRPWKKLGGQHGRSTRQAGPRALLWVVEARPAQPAGWGWVQLGHAGTVPRACGLLRSPWWAGWGPIRGLLFPLSTGPGVGAETGHRWDHAEPAWTSVPFCGAGPRLRCQPSLSCFGPSSQNPGLTRASRGTRAGMRGAELPGLLASRGVQGKCAQHRMTDYRHSPTPSTQAGLLGTPGRNRLRARGRSLRAPPDGVSCLLEGQPVSQFQSSDSRGTKGTGEMTAACAGAQGPMSGAQHPGAGGPGPCAGRSGSWLEKGGVAPGGRLGRQGKQDRRTEPGLALPTCGSPLEGTCGTCWDLLTPPGHGGEPRSTQREPTAPPALGRPCFPQVGSPAQPPAATGPPKGHRQSRVWPQLQPAGSLSPFPPGVWALDKNSLLINEGDTGEGTGSEDT